MSRRRRGPHALVGVLCVTVACSMLSIDVERHNESHAPLPEDCPVRFYRSAAHLGPCPVLGSVEIRDTGLSTNCGTARIREEVRRATCAMGGNAAVLTRLPGAMSTCVQSRAEIRRCEDPMAAGEHGPRSGGSGP
jgi:hypothetical protein